MLLLGLLLIGGCTRMGVNQGEPASAARWTAAQAMAGEAVSIARQPAETPLAARAVSRDGPGGYQRTTVPPGFLVLMLGVPLLILLL